MTKLNEKIEHAVYIFGNPLTWKLNYGHFLGMKEKFKKKD